MRVLSESHLNRLNLNQYTAGDSSKDVANHNFRVTV